MIDGIQNLQERIEELEKKVKKTIKLPVYITIVVAVISLLGSVYISYKENKNATNQKRLEVEKDLIIEAINGNSRTQIINNIHFFIDAGFLTLSKNKLIEILKVDSLIPIIDEQKTAETEFLNTVSITYPKNNTKFDTSVVSIGGTFKGYLNSNHKIVILAYLNGIYYPMQGDVMITKNKWQFDNVNINLTGKIKLLICIADKKGSIWLDSKVNNNFENIKTLHHSIKIIDFITVIR